MFQYDLLLSLSVGDFPIDTVDCSLVKLSYVAQFPNQVVFCISTILIAILWKYQCAWTTFPFGMDGKGSEYNIPYLTSEAICPKPRIFWNVY